MSRVERPVHVEVPSERVWAFVSDVRRCPEWVTFADGMGHVDEGDPGVGFRYVEYGGVGPLRSESEWRIVEFDPPRRQVHAGDMGIVDGELTITVEPEARVPGGPRPSNWRCSPGSDRWGGCSIG